jgi:YD repeat-containing protein
VTEKDGTEYRFGYNLDSENMVQRSDPSMATYIWRWSLDRIKDSNGNCIYLTYYEESWTEVYLDKIEYNNDMKRKIEFVREDKPDPYMTIDQGSEVIDKYRLSEIRISVNGVLARKYAFAYSLNEAQNKSLLTTITQYGADGVSALPPVKFEYKTLDKGFNAERSWGTQGERWIRKVDSDNDVVVETFDVNGNGLPDLISYDGDHWDVWFNNRTRFVEPSVRWSVPSEWDVRDVEKYIENDQAPDRRSSPIDIDRDGLVDFLWAHDSTVLQVKKNTGSGFASTVNWSLPVQACIREVQRPDGVAANVKQDFMDMNGDGLPDIVKKEDDQHWRICFNTGSSFPSNKCDVWSVPYSRAWLEDFTRAPAAANVQMGRFDMNGDGLPDIVDANGSTWTIWLNTGSNFINGGSWPTGYDHYITNLDSTGNVKRDLIDINGDGLPDIVNLPDGSSIWEIQFNTGKGFTDKISWPAPSQVPADGYTRDATQPDSDGNVYIMRDVFDIDGDGMPDIVRKTGDEWKVYTNSSGQADLLSKITDILGGTVTINYTSSMDYSNTRLSFNFWVVNSVTTNNGMTGPHALSSTTSYSYTQGLYDFPDREFRGFGEVTETRADASKVTHYYYQDNAKKGKEYKTETKSNTDAPFVSTENAWSGLSCESPLNGVYTCDLSRTDEYIFDGNPSNPKVITKEYQNYDSFGNVGLLINYGDISALGDETYAYNEYWPTCSSAYIVDRLKHRYVTASAGGAKLRENFYWYDDRSDCVIKGNLTKEENWLNTGSNPVTTHEYDAYGNRKKTTDPEGRITQTVYDSTYHTFPEQTINAKGHITTRSFDPAIGEVTQVIDPNGFITTYVYDKFKRKIGEIKPYDSDPPTVSIQYVMDGIPPESVIVNKKDGTPTFDTVQFIDGFGSLIQTKSEWLDSANRIAVDVFYDEMGRVKKQSNPYLTDNSTGYSTPNLSAPNTSYDYDALGRPVLIHNPDGTQVSRVFDHWSVTETDENGHVKSYTFDASQRLKQVIENNGGSSYTTNYIYSPLGELTNITDHTGNVTTIAYDSLGRKLQMTDPDMGTWNYGYDRVGNLTSQTDARGRTTNIDYDPLNRKLHIVYPNDNLVQFLYDAETKGTLSMVYSGAGSSAYQSSVYQYDQRLRKVKEGMTIDGNTWITSWEYDSMDRPVSMTYPNGQVVAFNYNAMGKLSSIPEVTNGISYNANGQQTEKIFPNGKTTFYSYYDANLRLNKITTSGIQDFTYTYDNVGNVKSIADAVVGRTENFSYDDLDRLNHAGDSGYDIQYQYNAIGNMTSLVKDGHTTLFSYGIGSIKPHAVTGMTVSAPVVGSFVLDNGNANTTRNIVTLNNISMGNPTYYMASEDKLFTGALWKTYSTSPPFLLSAGFGMKTVYFKIRNTDGESNVKSDTIEFRLNPTDAYLDDDGDGLTNMLEYLYGTDATKKDTDGDGLSDYVEVLGGKSNPKNPDSDNDGLNDPDDPYPQSPYHYSASENYVLQYALNEGGDSRSSSAYRVMDSLGNGFGKEPIRIQSHPALSINPTMVDYKTVKTGESRLAIITLSNSGMGDLVLQTLALAGTNAGEFFKQNDNCSGHTIIPSESCTLQIVFSPSTAGLKNANISILSNAPDIPVEAVPLFGVGTDTPVAPDISVIPTSHNFGNVKVGTISPAQTFTIYNTGTVNLQANDIGLTGGDSSLFNVTSGGANPCQNLAPTIAPGGNCTIIATFSPLTTGGKSTVLRIVSFDPDTPTLDVPLSGVGVSDNTPPTSGITSPKNGTSIFANTYIIRGTANDGTGSGVQKVEVSTDGGSTWNIATGTTSWNYVWTIPGVGQRNIKSRATDNANNLETPGPGITVTVVNRQPSAVTINGRKLTVNGNPFTIKGMGYSPVPVGVDPEITSPYGDYFTSDYSSIYNRDLPSLRDLGANTIRLWSWNNTADHLDFLDKAYNGGAEPIYVIAGFWINPDLDIDPDSPDNVREQLKADFREMVAIHKKHPATLMWAIGNELNAPSMYGNKLDDLFSLMKEMAEEAHSEEGANYHPVTTPLLDSNLISTISTYDSLAPALDVWSANVYRGNTFGTLFDDYEAVSQKPFVILEYGIDAYDNVHGNEYEQIGTSYQADYAEALWNEIESNSDICIGGSIMAYSDEWWKGKYGTGTGCPDNNPAFHSTCGYPAPSHPDGLSNEEWWGIMRTVDNNNNTDIMEPRAAYYRLQSLWVAASSISVLPVSHDFGNINVGSSSAPQTFTISNTGTSDLHISGMTLSDTTNYSLNINGGTSPCGSATPTIAPNSTCAVTVTFSPSLTGTIDANLTVNSDDPDTLTLNMLLTGTGFAPSASARVEIDHTYRGDLVVVVGVGNVNSPSWSTTVSNRAGGSADNLYVDVDISAGAAYLTPSSSNVWFLKVSDMANGDTGTIKTFRITYGGQTYSSTDPPVAINDNQTSYAYIGGAAPPPPPSASARVEIDKDFEDGLPAGWTVTDNARTGATWRFNDMAGRGNLTGGTGNFAIADSDHEGNVTMDTELRTPAMDLSSQSNVILQFKTDFRYYSGGGNEVADVDVSVNGAAEPWTNVWRKTGGDYRGPHTESINISAIAAGQNNVMIRFHYYNAKYDWWWQVDDVVIGSLAATFSISQYDGIRWNAFGLAVNPENGHIFLTSLSYDGEDNLREFTSDGNLVSSTRIIGTTDIENDDSLMSVVVGKDGHLFAVLSDYVGPSLGSELYIVEISQDGHTQYSSFRAENYTRGGSGITYDPITEHLFISSFADRRVFEVTLDGTLVNDFEVRAGAADVAFDPFTENVFVIYSDDLRGVLDEYQKENSSGYSRIESYDLSSVGITATPLALDINRQNGLFYVQENNERIVEFDRRDLVPLLVR